MRALLPRPSALIPLAISAFLIALIMAHVARFGVVHAHDEGTDATYTRAANRRRAHRFQPRLLLASVTPGVIGVTPTTAEKARANAVSDRN